MGVDDYVIKGRRLGQNLAGIKRFGRWMLCIIASAYEAIIAYFCGIAEGFHEN